MLTVLEHAAAVWCVVQRALKHVIMMTSSVTVRQLMALIEVSIHCNRQSSGPWWLCRVVTRLVCLWGAVGYIPSSVCLLSLHVWAVVAMLSCMTVAHAVQHAVCMLELQGPVYTKN